MKYTFIIAFSLVHAIVIGQVPQKRATSGDFGDDVVIPAGDIRKQMYVSANKVATYYHKDGKYGFIYPQDVKQEPIYDKIQPVQDGFFVKKSDLYGIANKNGVLIGKMEYDSIGSLNYTGIIVKKNGKYGMLSNNGSKLLSTKYHKILSTNKFVSFVQDKDGAIQMIVNDKDKPYASKIEYAALYDSVAIIKSGGRFGLFKKQLEIPLVYDSIFISSMYANNNTAQARNVIKKQNPVVRFGMLPPGSLITLQKDNKYGLANLDGAVIYPAVNDAVSNQLMYRYYTVKKGNLYGIYFTDGKKRTEIEFDKVYADGIGYVMATKQQLSGVFDLQGKQIVPFEYDPEFVQQYRIGFGVTKNKKRGIVGKNGEVLVPPVYDDVDPFFDSSLGQLVAVKSGNKSGVVNLKGEVIIPVEFEWIGDEDGFLKVATFDKHLGLYNKSGKVVVPAEYEWLYSSKTENSNLMVMRKAAKEFNFMNKNTNTLVLKENATDFGYVHNQSGLLNPFSANNKYLLFVQGKTGKKGMLNEMTGLLDIPIAYDEIVQRFDSGKTSYYSVKNGNKYGLIDDQNKLIIPLEYDAISVDLVYPDDKSGFNYTVVVAKGTKYGAVNLKNQVQIPFQYDDLRRISANGLYKAKVGSTYILINSRNEIINKGPFDEVANFEGMRGRLKALTFYKGMMRVIDDKGNFQNMGTDMKPHIGYKTFDDLKWALVNALDSKDDALLKDFAAKIAPSQHLLYYLTENPFSKKRLEYIQIAEIKEKYYRDLLRFKTNEWNQANGFSYNRALLTEVIDYTLHEGELVTNKRTSDQAFGDSRFLEKLLRNAYKVNGYWISSYFMHRNFDLFKR